MVQDLSISAIAALKRIQESTVQSYLADGIAAGHGYQWGRLGVVDSLLASVVAALAAMSASAAATAEPAAGNLPEGAPVADDAAIKARIEVLRNTEIAANAMQTTSVCSQQHAASLMVMASRISEPAVRTGCYCNGATGVFAKAACRSDDVGLATFCSAEAARSYSKRLGMPLNGAAQQRVQPDPVACAAAEPPDIVSSICGVQGSTIGPVVEHQASAPRRLEPDTLNVAALLDDRIWLKAVKLQLPEDVSYGQLRLACAHLLRVRQCETRVC